VDGFGGDGSARAPLAAVLSDADVMGAVAARHGWALAEIRRRHGVAVWRAALRVVGDHSRADDVAQEVFIRVWCAPHLYDPRRGSLRAHLQRDARGRGIDLVRSEESRRRRELRVVGESAPRVDPSAEPVDEWEHVRIALRRLPVEMRAAVDLAFWSGCTYRQVAALLDIPEGTAKSRLRRALAALRDVLADDDTGREAFDTARGRR
jgi:RNA polymerase sigma-70 factor (ECF subfamily)